MRRILPLLIGVLLLASNSFAQSQATTGNIEGRIVDPQGAVVPNAAISATNQDTGFGKTVQSDGEGNFIFVLLPPGNYRVEATAQGFAKATYENVVVTVGAKRTLEINLSVGAAVNVVDVQTSGDVVETTRTSISSTVDERRVTNLPTNGRNFLDFVTLTPGIVRDPTRSGDLAVGGQKGTLNSLQIDGASSDNTFFGQSSGRIGSGRAPSQFSIDTVKEFQVNQNGFSAEFGRAAGAVINVVTKSGTNRFSGSGFYFFRDESLNAISPVLKAQNRAKPFGQIHQFGGTFGGPIKKDRVFFFAAYEGQRSDLPNPVVLNSLAGAPASVRQQLAPLVEPYNLDREQDNFLGKVDFNVNDRNQLWARFNQQNFTGTNLENSGTLRAVTGTGNSLVKTSTLTSSWTSTLSPTWFNEFRFQYARDRQPGQANSNDPETNITTPDGTFSFGRNNFSPRETTITRYQFINNQTLIAGNHTIKYGADLLFDRIFNFFPGLFGGSYNFPSYAAFAAGQPSRFRQSFAGAGTTGPETRPDSEEYGFFVQEDWRVRPNLTLNLGVRYDYQDIAKPPITNSNPVTVQDPNSFTTRTTRTLLDFGYDTGFKPVDKNNIAPRLGFSYAFNEKTVLRGGYGIFYGRTPAIMTGTAHSQNGIQVVAIDITCSTATPCPTYPNVFTAPPSGANRAAVNLYLFSRDYKQPFTHQARVQFEREVFANTTFSVQYTMFRGNDLSRTRNVNLFAPVDVTVGGLTFKRFQSERERFGDAATNNSNARLRPIRDFDRISLFESTANSFYQGLTFEFNRRFTNRWQFSTSYTLSKAKDDKPDQTSVVPGGGDDAKIAENQFDLSGEYGRSDLDVRHRFIASTVYETGAFRYSDNKFVRALLSDYIFTGIFTAQSGFAYSALVSNDPNGDGINSTDRVPGTRRNQFSTPASYIFDVRVGRVIRFGERARLSLFAEGFNIFNRPNVQLVNNTQFVATVSGGRLTAVAPNPPFGVPRQFISGSPSFTFNSSYNREFQLGVRFDF
jgi:outer membrane receptor protein involved in Fe transport